MPRLPRRGRRVGHGHADRYQSKCPLTAAVLPLPSAASRVLAHPGAFALRVLKGFRANQGLLLAGAVAYYALLSLVPLLILVMILLSHAIDPERLLSVLSEYLAFVVPGGSDALVDELRRFVEHRYAIGGVLLVSLIFFSALAFTTPSVLCGRDCTSDCSPRFPGLACSSLVAR